MADFGHIALIVGLVSAIFAAVASYVGARWEGPRLVASARSALFVTFGMTTMATVVLLVALVNHDFQFDYVASYTSRDMPLPYLISAFWAGNAGSLLLWGWFLTVLAVLMVSWKNSTIEKLLPYAVPVAMATAAFFLFLLVFVASPFDKLSPVPGDGTGLNPLLQNPGMIFHPPTLLLGFAAMTIPFALAMSALLNRTAGSDWLNGLRRWVLFAWIFLTIGNVLGAWWAYVELGWGGYWGWDPVENSSLIPWLVATALLHAIVMQRSRGRYKVWVLVLTIAAFVLPIVATFFTRTGVLSSVHAFDDTGMGPLFLYFIGLSIVGSAILVYLNRDLLRSDREPGPIGSKEGALRATNVVFVIASVIILLGTMFPLFSKIFGGEQANLEPGFFNLAVGPFFLMAILLIGICTLIGWKRTTLSALARVAAIPLAVACVLILVLAFATSAPIWAVFAFGLSALALCAVLVEVYRVVTSRSRERGEALATAFARSLRANKPRYAAMTVHLGLVILAFGVIGSSALQTEKETSLALGETTTVGRYTITYEDLQMREDTPSVDVVSAVMSITNSGKDLGLMVPQRYFHRNFEQPVTEVAIRSTWQEDLYIILAGWEAMGETAAFQIVINPAVMWIWIGGGLLTVGGVVALWGRRRPAPAVRGLADDGELEDEAELW